jgi:hypothetical protein
MTDEQLGTIMYHWIALRAAVKLEKAGMHRSRQPSARQIAVKELGLPKVATYDAVLDALDRKINPPKFELAKTEPRCPSCGQKLTHGFCKCDNDYID